VKLYPRRAARCELSDQVARPPGDPVRGPLGHLPRAPTRCRRG